MYDYDKYIENDYKGLPRPTKEISEEFREIHGKTFLAKVVPIPWQSIEGFDQGNFLEINPRNEHRVYRLDLCPYCGIKINDDEYCIRWLSKDNNVFDIKSTRVPSDIHPFHIECMKEGRIFCPFMKKEPEENFEYGLFIDLKKNALKQLGKI